MDALRVYYGGTFDPVHNGHLAIARIARDTLRTTIRMMPAADPPHRTRPGATAAQRARMLEVAVAGESGLVVDRIELARETRSYSVDTLRGLRREIGDTAPVALLVGADSFLGLPHWHEWRELLRLCHFIVAERPGSPLDEALPPVLAEALDGRWVSDAAGLDAAGGGRVLRLRHPLRLESATDIRRRIAAGDAGWRECVPGAVAGYIERNGLYGLAGPEASSKPCRTPDAVKDAQTAIGQPPLRCPRAGQ